MVLGEGVIIMAVSKWMRFRRMERPGRNPCWRGRIQGARCCSQRLRAAEATMRWSQLTMLRGRVLLVVKALVPSAVAEVLFLGRQTSKLWL